MAVTIEDLTAALEAQKVIDDGALALEADRVRRLENKLLDSNQIIADKQKTPESPGQVQQ